MYIYIILSGVVPAKHVRDEVTFEIAFERPTSEVALEYYFANKVSKPNNSVETALLIRTMSQRRSHFGIIGWSGFNRIELVPLIKTIACAISFLVVSAEYA